jgi:hypothetical protein
LVRSEKLSDLLPGVALADFAPITPTRSQGLVDVLDRILDKGLVIAGDIKVNLANVELLTVQVRLLVCSIDKAEQIGLNWWKFDTALSGPSDPARLETENRELRDRIQALEQRLNALAPEAASSEPPSP